MCSKHFNNGLGVNQKFEPVLTLHCLHDTVGDAVGKHELQILVLVVVLKVVVVLVGWNHAPAGFGADVKKERKIELVVVNLGIGSHSPIHIEFATFSQLADIIVKLVNLIIQLRLGHLIQIFIDDAGSEHIVCRLDYVLGQVKELAVDKLAEGIRVVQS